MNFYILQDSFEVTFSNFFKKIEHVYFQIRGPSNDTMSDDRLRWKRFMPYTFYPRLLCQARFTWRNYVIFYYKQMMVEKERPYAKAKRRHLNSLKSYYHATITASKKIWKVRFCMIAGFDYLFSIKVIDITVKLVVHI